MKNILLKITISLSVLALIFTACQKDEPEVKIEEPVNTVPPIFNWQLNTGTSFSSDSTFCYTGFNDIYAFRNGLANSLEIKLSALTTGTYNISSANGIALTLTSANKTYTANSGKVIINASSSNKISGTVNATFNSTVVSSLSGNFTDVTKR
jgi:hypothetical protein